MTHRRISGSPYSYVVSAKPPNGGSRRRKVGGSITAVSRGLLVLRLPLPPAVVVLAALAAAAPGVALAQDPSTDVSVAGLDHIKDQWAFSSDALFNVQPAWKISQ